MSVQYIHFSFVCACFRPQSVGKPGRAELHVCADGHREQAAVWLLPPLLGGAQLLLHPQVRRSVCTRKTIKKGVVFVLEKKGDDGWSVQSDVHSGRRALPPLQQVNPGIPPQTLPLS